MGHLWLDDFHLNLSLNQSRHESVNNVKIAVEHGCCKNRELKQATENIDVENDVAIVSQVKRKKKLEFEYL